MKKLIFILSLLSSATVYSQHSFDLRIFGGPTYSLVDNSATIYSPLPSGFEVRGKFAQTFGFEVKYKSVFASVQSLTSASQLKHGGFSTNYEVDVFEKAQTGIIAVGKSFHLGELAVLKVAGGFGKTKRSSTSYTSNQMDTKVGAPNNKLEPQADKGLLIQLGVQVQPFKNNQNFLRKFDLELGLSQFLYRINQFDYTNTITVNNESHFFSYRNRAVLTTLNVRLGFTI